MIPVPDLISQPFTAFQNYVKIGCKKAASKKYLSENQQLKYPQILHPIFSPVRWSSLDFATFPLKLLLASDTRIYFCRLQPL
jgi:hypothetical protein